MEKLFVILLPICISIFIAELLIFIAKGIIFISYVIAEKDVKVNFKGNIFTISILSFIITFLLLII